VQKSTTGGLVREAEVKRSLRFPMLNQGFLGGAPAHPQIYDMRHNPSVFLDLRVRIEA